MIKGFGKYFTREDWYVLPLDLRQWWWKETDFDKKPPGELLMTAVREALKNKREALDEERQGVSK